MIQQPQNWNSLPSDEVAKSNNIREASIVKVRVMRVKYNPEYMDNNGNTRGNSLALYLDITEGNYKGIWSGQTLDDWNKQGVFYVSLKQTENCQKMFKRIVTIFEKSNPNYHAFVNGEMDEASLIGKVAVATIGEEEYEHKGEIKTKFVIRDLRSLQSLAEGKIELPKKKVLKGTEEPKKDTPKPQYNSISTNNPYDAEVSEEDLPF